jgi:hypothetical protein
MENLALDFFTMIFRLPEIRHYTIYKKVIDFSVPRRGMSLTKLSLAGIDKIIPGRESLIIVTSRLASVPMFLQAGNKEIHSLDYR